MAAVFICYRRQDAAGYAGRLRESLERRLGSGQIFRDVDTLNPGQDFVDAIEGRLRDCGALIALIGREWLDARDAAGRRRLDDPDDYVRMEIAAALQRPGLLVVPVLVEGATMPSADELPDSIRALARRHAITLRDETWDTDMDRLASALGKACGEPLLIPPVPRRTTFDRRIAIGAALLVLAIIARIVIPRIGGGGQGSVVENPALTETGPAAGPGPSPAPDTEAAGAATAIDIPRIAEVAHGDLIYTLMSGTIARRGDRSTVRLRFRVSNEGPFPTNLWDESFRLAVSDHVLAPNSGLNEIAEGQSVKPAIVSFDIPAGVDAARLRVTQFGQTAELPLDLSEAGRPAENGRADSGEVPSRAIVSTPISEAKPLLSRSNMDVTLLRVTARRFVNKLRVIVATRITNGNTFPLHSSWVTLRLSVGDSVVAPVKNANDAVNAGAHSNSDFVFEVPPMTTTATLRAIAEGSSTDVPLALQTEGGS